MVPVGGLKEIRVPEVLLRVKGGPKVLWREKGVEMKSYAGAVKLSPGRGRIRTGIEKLSPRVLEKGRICVSTEKW